MSRASILIMVGIILMLSIAPAMAGYGYINISGTNASNAQANMTDTRWVGLGASTQANVTVTAWGVNGSVKTFIVNTTNASDTLNITIYNITVGIVEGLTVNNTPINGYQANSSGAIVFNYTIPTGNATFTLQAAQNAAGWNATWAWFQNISFMNGVVPYCVLTGCTMTGDLKVGTDGTISLGDTTNSIAHVYTYNLKFPSGGQISNSLEGGTSSIYVGSANVFFPVQATTALAPAYVKGGIYYDTTLSTTMEGGAAGWQKMGTAALDPLLYHWSPAQTSTNTTNGDGIYLLNGSWLISNNTGKPGATDTFAEVYMTNPSGAVGDELSFAFWAPPTTTTATLHIVQTSSGNTGNFSVFVNNINQTALNGWDTGTVYNNDTIANITVRPGLYNGVVLYSTRGKASTLGYVINAIYVTSP